MYIFSNLDKSPLILEQNTIALLHTPAIYSHYCPFPHTPHFIYSPHFDVQHTPWLYPPHEYGDQTILLLLLLLLLLHGCIPHMSMGTKQWKYIHSSSSSTTTIRFTSHILGSTIFQISLFINKYKICVEDLIIIPGRSPGHTTVLSIINK